MNEGKRPFGSGSRGPPSARKPPKHRSGGEADGRFLRDPAIRALVVIGPVVAGPVFFFALVLLLVLQVNALVAVHFASRR